MKALIIVDLQNDFLPKGALAVPDSDGIIDRINEIQKKYSIVVATQDWHPADHKSFASQHQDKKPFDVIDLNENQQTLWPDHCVQGSKGAELTSKLNTDKISAIFRKGTDKEIDSYSAFYDNNKKRSTGLHGYLQELNVDQVFICGLAADFCVYYTAKDALELGYSTTILDESTKPIDAEKYQQIKDSFIAAGGKISSYIL